MTRYCVELQTKVHEDFTSMEKAEDVTSMEKAISWLKVPTSAFTFKILLRHYAKWALTPQKEDLKLGWLV